MSKGRKGKVAVHLPNESYFFIEKEYLEDYIRKGYIRGYGKGEKNDN
jgi:hypothetical protein